MKTEGYAVRRYEGPVKRYCQFLEIENNPELIRLYRECHGEDKHWKEIRDGIRAVGILEMEMYITGRYVVMIVETAPDFDWDSAMARLAQMPRQAEWETFMSRFQGCSPEASANQKWTMMERMFRLYD